MLRLELPESHVGNARDHSIVAVNWRNISITLIYLP
jgi:hypothetical protein